MAIQRAADLAALYLEMWNTGDTSRIADMLAEDWRDHAHPEINGPTAVAQSVASTRAARPLLRFDIAHILADGTDTAAVVGGTSTGEGQPVPLVWVFREQGGRLREMWTYRR
jgi:hypothetical protein